jgi:hypothetical protein
MSHPTPTLRAEPTPDRPQANEARLPALCPRCGEELRSECRYVDPGRGFHVRWACSCGYKRTL